MLYPKNLHTVTFDNKMITYNVRVMPNSEKCSVEDQDGLLKVRVNAPAVEGKANEAVLEQLAKYLKVRRSSLMILKGENNRNKVIGVRE